MHADFDSLASLAHMCARGRHVQRTGRAVHRQEPPRRLARWLSHHVLLIRQADPHHDARRAFRRVDQGRRWNWGSGNRSHLVDDGSDSVEECVVEVNSNPPTRSGEVDLTVIARVPVFTQQQAGHRQLDPLRLPDRRRSIFRRAALELEGHRRPCLGLDHVDPGHQSELGRIEGDRPSRPELLGVEGRQRLIPPVDGPVHPLAFDGEVVLAGLLPRPREVEEARAIDELVHHSRRKDPGLERELVVSHGPAQRTRRPEWARRQPADHRRRRCFLC